MLGVRDNARDREARRALEGAARMGILVVWCLRGERMLLERRVTVAGMEVEVA